MGSFETSGGELPPETWQIEGGFAEGGEDFGNGDDFGSELQLWHPDDTDDEVDIITGFDDGKTLAGYAADEALEILSQYPGSYETTAETEEASVEGLEANEAGEADSPEERGKVLICGGEGPHINPDQLAPGPDGAIGDFSWWFNGSSRYNEGLPTSEETINIRPARNNEARTIIASQFGASEATLDQALSGLGIDAKTALNRWHMNGDWGEATYGDRVLTAITRITQEVPADQQSQDPGHTAEVPKSAIENNALADEPLASKDNTDGTALLDEERRKNLLQQNSDTATDAAGRRPA